MKREWKNPTVSDLAVSETENIGCEYYVGPGQEVSLRSDYPNPGDKGKPGHWCCDCKIGLGIGGSCTQRQAWIDKGNSCSA